MKQTFEKNKPPGTKCAFIAGLERRVTGLHGYSDVHMVGHIP